MKTRKKLLIALLSATCLTAGAFGLAACDKESNDPALYGIYTAYVTEANEKNETPLSYADWLKNKFSSVGEKGEDGEDGEDGQPGANGQSAYQIYVESVYKADPDAEPMTEAQWLLSLNGVTPHIGDNGNWYLGTIDTGVKAAGVDGTNGVGIKGINMSEDGTALEVTLTDDSVKSIPLPEYITHKHTYGNEFVTIIPATGTVEGLGYKKCTQNGCDHFELYVIPCYAYRIHVIYSDVTGQDDSGNYLGTAVEGAKVTLKNSDGETVAEATTDTNGDAIFDGEVDKDEYDIVVEKTGYISMTEVDEDFAQSLGKTSKDGVDFQAILATLPTDGNGEDVSPYELTTEFESEVYYLSIPKFEWNGEEVNDFVQISFTASKGGAYTFSTVGSIELSKGYEAMEQLTVVLNEGETCSFQIQTGSGDYDYLDDVLLSVYYEPADEGSVYLPVNAGNNEKVSYSTEKNKEVYFKISCPNEETKVKITFGENVTVYAVGGNTDGSRTLLSSGEYINFSYTSYGFESKYQNYYIVAFASDGNIEFTTEPIFLEGEKGMPVELEGAGTYNLSSAPKGSTKMWYTLEVDEETTFTFDQSASASNSSFYFYSGEEINEYNPDYNSSSGKIAFTFQSDTVYFIRVTNFTEESQFTVRAFDATEDAGISPKAPLAVSSELETVAGDKYYVYTVESDGYVLISSNSYVDAKIYTDESFTGSYLGLSYNSSKSNYANSVKVSVGDKIYLNVNDYTGGDTIAITEIANDVQYDYTVTVQVSNQPLAGLTVKLVAEDEEVVATAVTDDDGVASFKAVPGTYSVAFDFTGDFEDYLLSGSASGVSVHLNSTRVSLIKQTNYEVTVNGLDALESVAGVKVALYMGRYNWMSGVVYDDLVEEYDITDGKVSFKFAPTSYYGYQLKVIGLPEGFAAEPVDLDADDLTLTIVEDDNSGEDVLSGVLKIGETVVTVTESGTYNFSIAENAGEIYITVTGGYIDYLKENKDVIYATGSDKTSFENDYTYGSDKYTITIVPTSDDGAVVTVTTVSFE